MSDEAAALILLSLARWITDFGIVWLVGVCTLRFIIVGVGVNRSGFGLDDLDRRLVYHTGLALALLLIAAAARLYAQTYSSFGLDEPVTRELLQLVAEQTRWGGRWRLQAVVLVVALLVVPLLVFRVRGAWWTLVVVTLGVVTTAPLTGHAIAYSGGAAVPMMLQIGHLAAAGIWLGTLLVVVLVALPVFRRTTHNDGLSVSCLIERFSPIALAAAITLALTGVLTALLYIDEIPQLWHTIYGRVLALKTALFGVTALLGAYNWRRVRPRLTVVAGIDRLRWVAIAELLIALSVLTVTAFLVHLPMPHE